MNLKQAKQTIEKLQHFVNLTKAYEANSFETNCIKEYAIHGNVATVAKIMNELEFRIGNRKVESNDVSEVIKSKPKDQLHEFVHKYFKQNVKSNPYL